MDTNNEKDKGTSNSDSNGILDPKHAKIDEISFIFVNINAVLQLFGDLILEILHITPTRISYLGLAFVHAFGSAKTLLAIKQHKVRFLHEDIQLMIVLEICLIIGDVLGLLDEECQQDGFDSLAFFTARGVFIVLSIINLCILLRVMFAYRLYHLTYVREDDPIDKAYFETQAASETVTGDGNQDQDHEK